MERTHHLDHHRDTDPVVPRLAEVQVSAGEFRERAVGSDRIARPDAESFLGVLAVPGTDVDEHVPALEQLLPRVGLHDVHRLDACDAGHGPVARHDHPALVDERLVQPPAERLEPHVAFAGDAPDDQPELVHVRREHDPRTRLRGPEPCHERSEPVGFDAVGERFKFAPDDGADGPLEPGRPRRV